MSTPQQPEPAPPPPPDQASWGAPPQPPPERRPRWSPRRIAVAVAVAVGIAAGGGVAIYAASGSATDEGDPARGPRGGGPVVLGGPMSDLDHGEFQNGEVTAISDTSITARSDDGYERTYTIDDQTRLLGDVEKGDDVLVTAAVEGDTATAVSVVDQGELSRRPEDGGPPRLERG